MKSSRGSYPGNFAEPELDGVHCPFGAGCASIVKYPMLEHNAERPRAVLGMFDISARPFVKNCELTIAIPMGKFASMVNDMEESFLITKSWSKVLQRRSSCCSARLREGRAGTAS